jgi:hypothetical protein
MMTARLRIQLRSRELGALKIHRWNRLTRLTASSIGAATSLTLAGPALAGGRQLAREEWKWQNIDADDLPAEVKKSFYAMIEAEAVFKADLEKLLKNEGHMPEDKFLVMSRKGKRLGVAYASAPQGEGGARSLKFKTK